MSAVSQIVQWANKELTPWQSDAVRRLLIQGELTEVDRVELLTMAKAAANLPVTEPIPVPKAPELGEVPGTPIESMPVILQAIEDVRNVNFIEDGAKLPFAHSGLTIVYGQNGTGKSGFARVLKRACRARDKDERVRPNVFVSSTGAIPSANIRLTVSGKPDQILAWREGGAPPSVLANVSVFDARCARVIVDEKNELQYLPYGADVFEKLAALVAWVQERFRAEKPTPLEVTDSNIGFDTRASAWLKVLSGRTGDDELAKVATWALERENVLVEAKKKLALLEAGDTTKEIGRLQVTAQRLAALKAKAQSVAKSFDDRVKTKAISAITDVIEKQKASALIAEEAASAEPLPGVGTSSAWKTLYQAARAFSIGTAYPGETFPYIAADARCVLCLQPIMDEARERFTRFRKFMESTVEAELGQAIQSLAIIRREITESEIPAYDTYATVVEDVQSLDTTLSESVRAYFSTYEERKRQLIARIDELSTDDISAIPIDIVVAIDMVIQLLAERERSLKELSKPEELVKLRAQVREETAWQTLAKRSNDVRARRDALALEALYVTGYKALRPTGITVAGRGIVDATLTPALIGALKSELGALDWGTNAIQIRPEGRDGTTRIQFQLGEAKALGNARLSDILSEGEQRALAIAGFLAEVKVSGHRQPVVFDDPVSSLDHLFTRNVAIRLVREALERQVVVFTHDLALLVELSAAAEEMALRGSPVASQVITISRLARTGVAAVGHPWEGAATKERAQYLTEALAKIGPLHGADKMAYNREAAYLYSRLREAWENLVERDLLGAVVTRYRLSVQTLTLWEVQVEDEDVRCIDAAMTKASRFMVGHATSLHLSTDRPSPDEIAADIESLRTYAKHLAQRRQRTKAARKQALQPVTAPIG